MQNKVLLGTFFWRVQEKGCASDTFRPYFRVSCCFLPGGDQDCYVLDGFSEWGVFVRKCIWVVLAVFLRYDILLAYLFLVGIGFL